MKYLLQLLIILAFSLLGELLRALLPLPVPASIYGIVLLFLSLEMRIVRVEKIRQASSLLLELMPIMFVPPAVGLLRSWDIVRDSIVEYVLVMVVSTFVVMFVAGHATQLIIKRRKR